MPVSQRRTLVRPPLGRKDAELPTSHLGRALTIKGILDTEGELHVQGNVLGQINADRLVIGAEGYVEGDVIARGVRIRGRGEGPLFAVPGSVGNLADITGRVFHHLATVE